MKFEVIIIIALAAALAFHRQQESSLCGPSGCLLVLPDFQYDAAPTSVGVENVPGVRESAIR